MAIIKPFNALRPNKEAAKLVAALPYDVLSSDEAREVVKNNNLSFLRVDKAEVDLDKDVNIYDDKVYETAAQNLNHMVETGVLVKDEKPCFYIYSLEMEKRVQTGLVVCTSIDEYLNNTIKKHEFTRQDKEIDRIKHVDVCNANTGPIFLTYRFEQEINEVIENWKKQNSPVYDFVADDGIAHCVWVIDDESVINVLEDRFKAVKALYIADGHHRNASAVKVGLKRREENKNHTGNEEYNYYLSVLFPDVELKILDYNRIVKDLNGLDKDGFIDKLGEFFEVTQENNSVKPQAVHTFGMYLEGKWFKLVAKPQIIPNHVVGVLDVSILQEKVLTEILGIKDIRTDDRINFVGGIRGLGELEKLVDSGKWKVAFSLYPTSVNELMNIADADEIMPPKSTWFEPKLRSGIFIHTLD